MFFFHINISYKIISTQDRDISSASNTIPKKQIISQKSIKYNFKKHYNPFKNKQNEYEDLSISTYFDANIPPVIIKRLLTTSTGGIDKYFSALPISFVIAKDGYNIFFVSNNKIYKIIIQDLKNITFQSQKLNLSDPKICGGLAVDGTHVVLTLLNREIRIFDYNLKLIKQLQHQYGIVSKPVFNQGKMYFIDISDSIVEMSLEGKFRYYIPQNLGSRFDNCSCNFLITDNHIFYGSSTSSIHIVNRSNFTLHKTIPIHSEIMYIHNKPILYDSIIYVCSDAETLAIDSTTMNVLWSLDQGSFTNPIIIDNYLLLGSENYLYAIDISHKEPKVLQKIFFGSNTYLLKIFAYKNIIFAVDTLGHVNLINLKTGKFQKCGDNLITKHTPLVHIFNDKCFLLILNCFAELELHELKLL